jgi:hypothetical protein
MSCNRDVTQKVGCMFKRAHANVEHQPPALLKVNSSSVHHTFLVYRRLRHEGHTPQPPMATMDLCASNDTSLWSRCWRAKGLSGHGGYSNTGTCPHYPSHELFLDPERRPPHRTQAILQSRQHAQRKANHQHSSYHNLWRCCRRRSCRTAESSPRGD